MPTVFKAKTTKTHQILSFSNLKLANINHDAQNKNQSESIFKKSIISSGYTIHQIIHVSFPAPRKSTALHSK